MMTKRFLYVIALAMTAVMGTRVGAQVQTEVPPAIPGAKPVTVEHIKVHGTALEGNLEGDAVDRDVLVFLPPSYKKDRRRRYPVVYALHGYSIGAEQWSGEIHVPQTIEGAFAQGAKEVIVVLPDSKTLHNGSMYSSSVTTGDFEQFIAHDLVAYIDAHYRTLPNRLSRGLVGHSMGGYGATRIGMKHADVFRSLYIMSPCCLSPRPAAPANPEIEKALEAVKSPEDSAKLSFFARAQLATAAAWSPDPNNPPLYLDLPTKDGVPQPDVFARWAANAPLAFVDQYVGASDVIALSPLMWATRTVYDWMPASCTKSSTSTESRTALKSIRARTRARWPNASRTTSCRSSAAPSVFRGGVADRQGYHGQRFIARRSSQTSYFWNAVLRRSTRERAKLCQCANDTASFMFAVDSSALRHSHPSRLLRRRFSFRPATQ